MANIRTSLNDIYFMENLADDNSFIHLLTPSVKVFTTLVFIIAVISTASYNILRLLFFLLYIIVVSIISQTDNKLLFKRYLIVLPFSFFVGIGNIFVNNNVYYEILNIPITFGFISFIGIILKSYITVMAVFLLVSTTRLNDIFAFMGNIKVPKIIVNELNLTFRYIHTLADEAGNMYTSYILRSNRKKGIDIKDMGSFLGNLLLRSVDKADKVYNAMKLRGYNGEYNYSKIYKYSKRDYISFIIFFVYLVISFYVI